MAISYWWVNHKQTRREEVNGGYIWSPRTKKNGHKNETYLSLKLVQAGDLVFSYANTYVGAIGVAQGGYVEADRPSDFRGAGQAWDVNGWRVPIAWTELNVPLRPREQMSKIGPLLPGKYSPIRENGHGNEAFYLTSIPADLGGELLALIDQRNGVVGDVLADSRVGEGDRVERELKRDQFRGPTQIEQLVKARRGQGRFRENLLSIEKSCRLTRVSESLFLVASHIKPWAVCSDEERLDGHNGLLLAPHVDRLFDRGWISFSDAGEVLVANDQVASVLGAWGFGGSLPNVGAFTDRQKSFLDYHRKSIYCPVINQVK